MSIQPGDTAPDFTATTTEGELDFYDWMGDDWAVLVSRPQDFTSACTTGPGEVLRLKAGFDRRHVKIIGLSVHPLDAHRQWAGDTTETRGYALNVPLIADPDRKIADLYGMLHPNADDTLTVRSVVIISTDKKVKLVITYPASTGRNFDEILRVIGSLQLTGDFSVATPANWHYGENAIIVPALNDDETRDRFPEGWNMHKPYTGVVHQPSRE
jgi:alkyl hydroperoxide reductase subunit AhpC